MVLRLHQHPKVGSLSKPYQSASVLKDYLSTVLRAGKASDRIVADKLKNKVLQIDNPVKSKDARKAVPANVRKSALVAVENSLLTDRYARFFVSLVL